jgi:hypothetical protein
MVNMSVRQRYKLLQVSSDMNNDRLEDNSVVKSHILLKILHWICASLMVQELEPSQNWVFSNEYVPIQNSTGPSYHQIAITPGHNSGP